MHGWSHITIRTFSQNILFSDPGVNSAYNSQHLLKAVLEMNHMQMQDLIDYSDPDEGGENPAPDSLMRVRSDAKYRILTTPPSHLVLSR